MSPTPRPVEPQLAPEGLTDEDQAVPEPDETSTAEPAGEEARAFGNLTENLTTRWNVESR